MLPSLRMPLLALALALGLLAPSASIRSGGAVVGAKRGAPAAAPAQPARSSVIIA
jgi:hypothetical protein